jgi:uncharacterized protein YndB with AHSA1/START domain
MLLYPTLSDANAGRRFRRSRRRARSARIIEVEQSVMIDRPPGEVFTFLADLENWWRWQPDLLESEQTSRGPMDVGTKFRQAIEVGGQRIELYCEVTGYEEDERLSLDYARDGLSSWLGFHLEPVERGTRVTGKGEGRMTGFSSLFEPVVDRGINEQIKRSLDDLKVLLESPTPDA